MQPRPKPFQKNLVTLLNDSVLRANLKRGPANLAAGRRASFSDPCETDTCRDVAQAIRQRNVDRLPELLELLERNCVRNGIQVHWAETGDEANDIILGILQRCGAKRVVKGKSMATEETQLNAFLERNGIASVETDLGEYIVQLAGETPSHIIAPAFHKNRQQIAALLNEKLRFERYTDDAEELTMNVRAVLRQEYRDADAGISGVNFAVAETGTLCLVENEGNGRMCTTVPPVHIAVSGIEKVIEKVEDLPPLFSILCRSCTGQSASTYLNLISSPRKPGEKDGPEEVHLVLLDNGRSRIHRDPELRETLHCIRCAACLNVCPVYTRVGGHAYGHAYSGPIGIILNTQLNGLQRDGEQLGASSLCGACDEVCPVRIPISQIILRLRKEANSPEASSSSVLGQGALRKTPEAVAWRLWRTVERAPLLHRTGARLAALLQHVLPLRKAPLLRRWTRVRSTPHIAGQSLHDRVRELGVDNE